MPPRQRNCHSAPPGRRSSAARPSAVGEACTPAPRWKRMQKGAMPALRRRPCGSSASSPRSSLPSPSSTCATPRPSVPSAWIAVELESPTVSVECAAVVRNPSAKAAGNCATAARAPPQLTIKRCSPSENSKASVEAQPPSTTLAIGGGAASTISTAPPAASR
ncbi:hypothetical protein WR25_06982 [Diploscapter pachys]|uniref:Uncharacterized protein n=1 Tax=Diploscapter pachys TaxID=2018661 RepID=A0A2A2M4W9_9BILA|nr:hypothetical protein WR25_06982 [Diploscapter pachys]